MIQEKDKLVNIHAKVTALAFHPLLFPGTHNEEQINRIRSIFEEQNHGTHVETILLTSGTEELYRGVGMQNGGYYLVRPDMYVSYRSNRFSTDHLKTHLISIHL